MRQSQGAVNRLDLANCADGRVLALRQLGGDAALPLAVSDPGCICPTGAGRGRVRVSRRGQAAREVPA
jgi:hypothetical protein